MLEIVKSAARAVVHEWTLPAAAKKERQRDRRGISDKDPGNASVIDSCAAWLAEAQDRSISQDGGVARHYSLIDGWSVSYPETTGYIVPTMFDLATLRGSDDMRTRALLMLDWLVSIQFLDGGFQGGKIDAEPRVPVTFNTGQILIGLARGAKEVDTYHEPMLRAADWLTDTMDDDGCWRKFPTPFAELGEKAYETHVAWGLFEAARLEPNKPYAKAGLANIEWAINKQRQNGWVDDCCLSDPNRPLTHTLGYFLRGLLEAYRFSQEPDILAAARRTADGLISAMADDGHLPGRLNHDWSAAVPWVCLTGSAQIAHCWILLHSFTGEEQYKRAGLAVNRYVRRAVCTNGAPEIRGGVKGAFPVDGEYGAYEYLNWAGKFLIDSLIAEQTLGLEKA